ncbi:unnamed protein product [Symbiodinium natans]|uniref:Uncharacterized protein n=1 Tax=Symbiodinium natans TaxID=878477 RepID=A0A812UG97_9DINO|nr:unnamed protein product [Symbiodinium natans]
MVTVLAVLKLSLAVLWASLGISSSLKLSLSASANASSWSWKLSSGSNASTRLFQYGSTVAIYNPLARRFVQMNKQHQTMSATPPHDGDLSLPMHCTYERFTLVDAGHGRVALHNTLSNRFIKMAGEHVTISPIKASNHLPHDWGSEFFEVVDAGDGMVGLHQPGNNRFISMNEGGGLYGSPHHGNDQVPHGWTHQRFFLVPERPYLVPGSVVALYNRPANRFLRMHDTYMDGSGHPPAPLVFPGDWGWERFKVVDAGFGRVALHSHQWHRFVKMDHQSVTVSPHSDTGLGL